MKRIIPILFCLTLGSSCSFAKKLFQAEPEKGAEISEVETETSAVQNPQQSVEVETGAPVPESVVVPVVSSPAAATVSAPAAEPAAAKPVLHSERKMDRTERRQMRAERFAAKIDSVISSRDYVFSPNSMQEIPNGSMQLIYADYFYLGIMEDHVEVHLPVVRGGVMQYIQVLNFDTFAVRNYQASRTGCGWNISFDITDDKTVYAVNMLVSTVTGETTLTLLTMNNTMRYVGFISNPENRPSA